MVAIAGAVVIMPAVLVADERTGNVETDRGDRRSTLLYDINKQSGATLVLVTHDRTLAARCDRVVELEAGRQLS